MKVSPSSLLLSLWCSLCWTSSIVTYGNAFSLSPLSKKTSKTRLHYDIQRDPSNENVWNVLATTERWISELLTPSSAAAAASSSPLSRKEVSYVCETSTDVAMVVANIFRKLKEARQLGETHGEEQEEYTKEEEGAPNSPMSMRQTQVLVIPTNSDVKDWFVFDNMVSAINQARRSARDYVTDVSLDRLDDRLYAVEDDNPWVVSVNCAHLHPDFGKQAPKQELKELQEEEEDAEVDLNLQDYKQKRILARQSPFPSIVVEVRAMPSPVFTPPPPSSAVAPQPRAEEGLEEEEDDTTMVNSDFVQQLELLFSKSSLDDDKSKDGFYDSIGSHLEEVTTLTPSSMAQTWISQNDALFDATTCAFTTGDTPHVDAAYEVLFTNLAMQSTQFSTFPQARDGEAQKRQYLVLPNFCTSSATSMEKFAREAAKIIDTLPALQDKVQFECLHPEHVQEGKRCPVPVFVIQWMD